MTTIELLPIDPARDRNRIAEWLAAPFVSRWWGDPAARLKQFDATPAENHALIARGGVPIGYLRWETVSLEELAAVGLSDIPENAADVDIFIGSSGEAGRGAGPHALQLLFDRLRATTRAPMAGLCTSVDNHHAQAAFAKAGCTRLTQYDDPDYGPCFVFARQLR